MKKFFKKFCAGRAQASDSAVSKNTSKKKRKVEGRKEKIKDNKKAPGKANKKQKSCWKRGNRNLPLPSLTCSRSRCSQLLTEMKETRKLSCITRRGCLNN